jgi:predicted transcriptional regulator
MREHDWVEECSRKAFHNLLFNPTLTIALYGNYMEHRNTHRRPYRNRMEIAADILEISKNGSRKTRIMYLGNLSFDLLQKYLDMLVNLGLLEIRSGEERMYVATEKGRAFLENFNELQKHAEVVETKKRALEISLNLKPIP